MAVASNSCLLCEKPHGGSNGPRFYLSSIVLAGSNHSPAGGFKERWRCVYRLEQGEDDCPLRRHGSCAHTTRVGTKFLHAKRVPTLGIEVPDWSVSWRSAIVTPHIGISNCPRSHPTHPEHNRQVAFRFQACRYSALLDQDCESIGGTVLPPAGHRNEKARERTSIESERVGSREFSTLVAAGVWRSNPMADARRIGYSQSSSSSGTRGAAAGSRAHSTSSAHSSWYAAPAPTYSATMERSRKASLSSVSSTWDEGSRSARFSTVSSASNFSSVSASTSVSSSSIDRWAPQHASSSACNNCHEKFSLLKRSHRCRRCGNLFCQKCSSHKVQLAGHSHRSRVCIRCFPKVLAGNRPPVNTFIHHKAWVPRGVFAHMLSYLNHVDLCLASMTCRFWFKRAVLDLTWRPLYIREFGDDENSPQRESLVAFQRDVHGIGFDNLSYNQKFAVRWTARKAAEKKKSFVVMSSLLSSLGLSKYAPIFEAEEIDIESLCLMNAGHLRDLGIPFGPRMKLLNAAACLADFNEEDERPSMEPSAVTPVARFKQKKAEMKQYKASLVRRVQQSAVRIAILTNEGELCNVGSGIIIHEGGLIATARHCLQGEQFDCIYSDEYMILVAPTEETSTSPLWRYHARAIPECCDEELDYALLRIDCEVMSDPPSGIYIGDVTDRIIARQWTVDKLEGTSRATIRKLPAVPIGNSNNVEPGDEMWMFGYPSSGHNTITVHHAICSGTDQQIYNGEEVGKAMLRTAAQLDNGFSGGAAVDKKGQLVGLISFSVLRQDRVRAINMVKGAIEFAKRKFEYA